MASLCAVVLAFGVEANPMLEWRKIVVKYQFFFAGYAFHLIPQLIVNVSISDAVAIFADFALYDSYPPIVFCSADCEWVAPFCPIVIVHLLPRPFVFRPFWVVFPWFFEEV